MSIKNRWSDEELQIIRDVFGENDDFLHEIRDVMMGFSDKMGRQTTEKVLGILKKNLLPANSSETPLGKQQDLCHLSLDFIGGFNAEQGILRIKAFDLAQDYLERRFEVFYGKEDTGERLDDFKDKSKAIDDQDRFVRMLAYLQLNGYIEKSLLQLSAMATYKEKTPEELLRQEEMNSNK